MKEILKSPCPCPYPEEGPVVFSIIRVPWESKGTDFFSQYLPCCSVSLFIYIIFLSLSTVIQRTVYSSSLCSILYILKTEHGCDQSSFLWTKCSLLVQSLPLGAVFPGPGLVSVFLSFSKWSVPFLKYISLSQAVL